MRDLERVTGVSRDTIRFYIREELLPEPERTGRNSAWYDERFVDRVRFIRELREKRFLPLSVIRAIVAGGDEPPPSEVRTLLELDGSLFPAVATGPRPRPERLTAVADRLGIPAEQIRQLAHAGTLQIAMHDGDEWIDDTAVRVAEAWARMVAAGYTEALGFTPDNLRLYVDVVRWLARRELRLFTGGVTGRVSREQAIRMAEEGITGVNTILAELRKATLLRYVAEGNRPEPDAEPPMQDGADRASRPRIRRRPTA